MEVRPGEGFLGRSNRVSKTLTPYVAYKAKRGQETCNCMERR